MPDSSSLIPEEKQTLYRSKITTYRRQCAASLEGRILDCGGGLGDYLPYFHGKVTVLDLELQALRMLRYARKLNAHALHLPFANHSFDSVWACAVVQYLDLDHFMQEAYRVTISGGRILVLVPNASSPWDKIKKTLGMDSWWDQKGIVRHYTVEDLRMYGKVTGEVQFLPFEKLLRNFPEVGHTLMLEAVVP